MIAGLGVVMIGLMGFFAAYHLRTSSISSGPSEELHARELAIARQEHQKTLAAVQATINERVQSWKALLESIAATGEDKTKELAAFLNGPPEDIAKVAAAYQKEWSSGAENGKLGVVPGTVSIVKVVFNPTGDMAGVLVGRQVRLADGTKVRCLESTAWMNSEGVWGLATWATSYWCGGSGKLPFEQGTQVDGVVWSPAKVQENPPQDAPKAGVSVISVTFAVSNQAGVPVIPADYAIRIWTTDGSSHDVSALTEKLLPATKKQMQTPLLGEQQARFTLAFEVPVNTDLTGLQFEVTKVSATPSAEPSSEPFPGFVKPGTPHSWALAASAVLCDYNGMRDDLLAGMSVTSENAGAEKTALVQWWSIHSRDDLLAALEWLDQEGHRKTWDDEAAYLASLSQAQLQQVQSEAAKDPETKHQIEMVLKYAPTLGSKSLKGWDLSRYICLCRWGYLCGYLDEEEAWKHIMPVAAKLQATFSSWKELGENYLIGREFWSYEETKRSGDAISRVYQGLVDNSYGPWQFNKWDMDLGVAAEGTI